MNKESVIERQKIDCNCNDCLFMQRDFDKFQESLRRHEHWQLDDFNREKQKLKETANYWRYEKGDLLKWNDLMTRADGMKFQFDKSTAKIQYGNCTKLDKPITFIPNQCQLETQECFKHRKPN
jgi:hypothetical protein